MKINIAGFNEVAVGFEPLPPGTYTAVVTRCEPKKGKEKGTPYISWEFTIQGPTHAKRKLFENTGYGDGKSQPFTKRLVVGCGAAFTNDGFTTEDCMGKTVELVVGQKPDRNDESRINNTIDKISPIVVT